MLHSVLIRAGATPVRAHLLHPRGLDATLTATLGRWVRGLGGELQCHGIDDARVAELPAMGRISRAMWYRLFLPELLAGIDRVVYLDCDVIVRSPLDEFYGADLGDAGLGAVANVFEALHRDRPAALGLPPGARYFNSGVLLMDLGAWRAGEVARRILERVRASSPRLLFPDQDALNLEFAGRWRELHPRWNCQNSFFYLGEAGSAFSGPELAEAVRNPAIVHFEGGALAKPWHYLCKNPHRHLYFEHRRATPWPEQAIEGRTWVNRLLRLVPMRQLLPTLRLLQGLRRRLA